MKLSQHKWIKIFSSLLLIATVAIVYFIYSENASKSVIRSFFTAVNNQNCQKLQPLLSYSMQNHDILCPRGDVGNFMVIDKVEYNIQNTLGKSLGSAKQVLYTVCVEARGQAAWNEGSYKECTTDPKLIEFTRTLLGWKANIGEFTDISKLINESGAKPSGFDKYYNQCWETRMTEISFHGSSTINCNNIVGSDIEYAIKTHKFVQAGKAR